MKFRLVARLAATLAAVAGAVVAADNLLINGAGATFPAPLYTKWFSDYNKTTKGSIGYIELAYANQQKIPTVELKKKDGHFVKASLESTSDSEAAAGVEMPSDYRVSITNAAGKGSWPMASFTYLLVRKEKDDAKKGENLVKFLKWAVHEGQAAAGPLDYAPLPKVVVVKVDATLAKQSRTEDYLTGKFG